jgi:hypothetical protein
MTAAMRRVTPLLAALLLLIVVLGLVGRSCARAHFRSRNFVGGQLPARLPHATGRLGAH